MKNFKKILAFLLAAVMVLVPMTVLAEEAEPGSADNPYQLSTMDIRFAVYVEAGETAWVQVDDCNGSTLSVGYATASTYMVIYCRQPYYPDEGSADNTMTLTMVDGADVFSVYNAGEEPVTVYMALEAGAGASASGTMDNPEIVTIAENMYGGVGAYVSTDLAEGNQGYYYLATAPADGMLAISIGAFDADWNAVGWMYYVNNITQGKYGDIHYSDEEEPLVTEEIDVQAGDEILVFITTYNPEDMWNAPAGMVSVNYELLSVGSWGNPEKVALGDFASVLEEGSQGYYYVWTATASGSVTVSMNDAEGWTYVVNIVGANDNYYYGDTRWFDDDPVVASETFEVSAGDEVTVMVCTYDPADMWYAPAGTVNWSLSFEAGEGSGDGSGEGGDDSGMTPDDGEITYEISNDLLAVGNNDYTLLDGYTYTIFTFEPDEKGMYTFTADMPIGLVSTNGMWITVEPSDATISSNTFEWKCTGVGQTIWVAVKNNGASVNVQIDGDGSAIVEIPVTVYENKVEPQTFTYEGDINALTFVDTEDGIVDVAVLGADGFYHLGDEYGPILYADLNDTLMSLATVNSYGQLKEAIYENGVCISKIDYTFAYMEYEACMDKNGLYPLTEDLMLIYQGVGASNAWYGSNGWVGGDLEDAWMFACYYLEGERFDPEQKPEFVLGDVDNDGKINAKDYMMLKRVLLGTYEVENINADAADVDGDGALKVRDYMMLKRHILGTYDIYEQASLV